MNYRIIKTNWQWQEAIAFGYEVLLCGIDHRDVGERFIACKKKDAEEIFKKLTGFKYDDLDGTHGSIVPITETFGHKNLFN